MHDSALGPYNIDRRTGERVVVRAEYTTSARAHRFGDDLGERRVLSRRDGGRLPGGSDGGRCRRRGGRRLRGLVLNACWEGIVGVRDPGRREPRVVDLACTEHSVIQNGL